MTTESLDATAKMCRQSSLNIDAEKQQNNFRNHHYLSFYQDYNKNIKKIQQKQSRIRCLKKNVCHNIQEVNRYLEDISKSPSSVFLNSNTTGQQDTTQAGSFKPGKKTQGFDKLALENIIAVLICDTIKKNNSYKRCML